VRGIGATLIDVTPRHTNAAGRKIGAQDFNLGQLLGVTAVAGKDRPHDPR
jgi:hypothetical protein